MAKARPNNKTGSYLYYKTAWTGTAADYNILEQGPGGSVGCDVGECSRALIVSGMTTGSLVVLDAFGNPVTIPYQTFTGFPKLEIQAQKLVAAGSSAAYIVVCW